MTPLAMNQLAMNQLAEAPLPMPASDDRFLEQFLAADCQESFAALVTKHSGMVLGTCRRMLGKRGDADDAAQAVFILLWKKAPTLRGHATIGGWLHSTARNVCRNLQRSESARESHETMAAETRAMSANMPDHMEWIAIREMLDEEIERLPEKLRLPLILFHLEGHSLNEVAKVMSASVSTVGTWLQRAREKIAARLTRRGVALSAAALTSLLASNAAEASIPGAFTATTVQAASSFALGGATSSGAVSPFVNSLVKGGIAMSRFSPMKLALSAALTLTLIAGIAVATGTYLAGESPQSAADRVALQGEWQEIGRQENGQDFPEAEARKYNTRRSFSSSNTLVRQTAPDGKELTAEPGTFRLDANASPKTIDVTLSEGTAYGIYSLNGDELKLCVTKEGGPRPNVFQTKSGDRRVLLTLRRVR